MVKTVILPPPNVTGSLHMGHALNLFMQDAFVRFFRLSGMEISWVPGTDHAGIGMYLSAIQNLEVSKKPIPTGEDLIKCLWDWKEYSENRILAQIKSMHLSLDWNRYIFSLDAQEAVREAFVQLYEKGLIFRDKRIVSWDIKLQSVLSEIETESREVDGNMYYIRYRSIDGREIVIATTRPETIFADEAIAVHPDDERYTDLIGCEFEVPLAGHYVKVVTTENVDMTLGTGALKIDPAHSAVDFEIGRAYGLRARVVVDRDGRMCGDAAQTLHGKDRVEARPIVAEMLRDSGHLVKVEPIRHAVPHGIRSGSMIEPVLSDQWFMDLPKLQNRVLEVIESGKLTLHPASFESIYKSYEFQPWCISRQIPWGHKVPVWYDDFGQIYVARSHAEAVQLAGTEAISQDPDVLDTWFSSSLWPMLTAGWPGKMDGFPNEFLITGRDILFFWVIKMVAMSVALLPDNTSPFKHVLLHGLVQDSAGAKMSKSKGNVVDPLLLIEEYGRDVISFALLSASASGRNIRFGTQNIEMAKRFVTKVKNGIKYALQSANSEFLAAPRHPVNIWITNEIAKYEQSKYMENWDVYHAANSAYTLFWDKFCDWYIECAKVIDTGEFADETRCVRMRAAIRILRILYPFIPLTVEELWPLEIDIDTYKAGEIVATESDFPEVQELVNLMRSLRSNFESENLTFVLSGLNPIYLDVVSKFARVTVKVADSVKTELRFGCGNFVVGIPGLARANAEPVILGILSKIDIELNHLNERLSNAGYMSNADEDDIKSKQDRVHKLESSREVYLGSLKS